TGDGDDFLDNCEVSNFSFAVENGGTVDLHDVRLVSVSSPSHPGTEVLSALPLPLADTLPGGACGLPETVAPASFSFVPQGMGFDEAIELEFRIEATSLEFGPLALEGTISFSGVESDFSFVASRTFSYETDLEGWRVVSGTYTRQIPGAAGTEFHLASSEFLPGQCDEIQSPELRLTESSTLQLFNQFSTEPESTDFFDRANVGLLDVASGNRTTVVPDGGRTYNASGPNGVCVTQGQPGWAGVGPGFLPSTWSADALRSADFAGRRVRLDVAYGTDPSVELEGFQFDELTLTDFELQSPDASSDVCPAPPEILANDDAAETLVDQPVTIHVLANDFTVSPPLTVAALTDPPHGAALPNGDGTVTYVPDPAFDGADAFGYTARDAAGRQASATVTVTVSREEEPPPPPCDPPGVEVASDPVGDTSAVAGGDPSLDITSLALAEPFVEAGQEKLVVTLEVVDLAIPHPSAAWRTFWTSPDGVTYFVALESCDPTVGLQCSFGTFDGTFFTSQGEPEGCVVDPAGTIVITVDKGLVGIDDSTDAGEFLSGINARTQVFLGALCTGALSQADNAGPASYPIFTNAACGGGRPVAADDAASTLLNTAVTIDVLANDLDPEGGALTVASVGQPANGTAANNGSDVTYTPNTGFLGSDSFEYAACDPDGLCDAATVAVEVHCPAQPDGGFSDDFEPGAEAGWTVQTARNDSPASLPWTVAVDPFAHSLTHAFTSDATTLLTKDDRLIAPPQNLSPTSNLVFWHRFVFEGSFDGGVLEVSTDGGNTWLDVQAGGGAFVEGGYNGSISSSAGSPIAGRSAWTDFSPFVDAMTRVEVDLGAFAGDGVRVRWRLAADPLAPGALPGVAWWIDDVEFTDTLTVPESCPLPPDAADDTAQTVRDVAISIDVLANDTDPNAEPLVVGRVDAASTQGGAVANNGADVDYDPPAGFSGTDTFTYDACDPGGLCDTATVVVLVEPGPSELVKVSGAGWIPDGAGGKAHFGFNADSTEPPPSGRITYESQAANLKLKGTVSSVTLVSPTEAQFSGSCQLKNGAPCTYSTEVEDHGEPGAAADRFQIQVFNALGQPIHEAEGLLGGGNIQIH
ncbi:MAG: tandem-95 repeat protein, partial [Chloroflexi bacterium]|nr:tandem-95 repeat protein [Chloroflexota bacterium]